MMLKLLGFGLIFGAAASITADEAGLLKMGKPEEWTVRGILSLGCFILYRDLRRERVARQRDREKMEEKWERAREVERAHTAELSRKHTEALNNLASAIRPFQVPDWSHRPIGLPDYPAAQPPPPTNRTNHDNHDNDQS